MELRNLCEVKDWLAIITRLEARIQAQTGLTLNHACAVSCLARGEKTAGELAREMRVSGPSLSRLLRPLLERGLIASQWGDSKITDFGDGRHKFLSLTDQGRDLHAILEEKEGDWFPLTVGVDLVQTF